MSARTSGRHSRTWTIPVWKASCLRSRAYKPRSSPRLPASARRLRTVDDEVASPLLLSQITPFGVGRSAFPDDNIPLPEKSTILVEVPQLRRGRALAKRVVDFSL